ncbi:pyridoxamine kinase [Campylobacter sp. JMF_02 ED1]|uniref:pyridoxamine kinase n=1 Tax=unclassified Campylobacter TaxID=2593542 RepID=UPI0022E9C2E1|nr:MULTISPECIES: pyridoxamine kinase [unclassified Campylobacter]MDA3049997.1 pyridoxamine kinase [Campylobacter sp. JMF_15 NE4]MDA3050955.1 pyridoxamine kinase [Campylobacter sp. JMF_02 ED1]
MKRVLSVQDISCVGKVSLSAALPVISAMGLSVSVLPTAVLSMHTGFSGFTFRDLTKDLRPIMSHWHEHGVEFDGIYTGFLGSQEQIALISELFMEFGGSGKTILVDPCMGDNGEFYPGFDSDFARMMALLCASADVITPNITEACAMVGVKYREKAEREFIFDLLEGLKDLGASKVILKGINYISEQCGVFSYDAKDGRVSEYFHELLPVKYNGTGDIFASVAFGAIMRGKSLQTAIRIAADFVVSAMKETMSDSEWRRSDGVKFELVIPELVRKI